MNELVKLLLGPTGLLVFVLFTLLAGFRGWWVFGGTCEKMEEKFEKEITKLEGKYEKEVEFWRQIALRGTELAEKAVTLSEKKT